MKFSKVFAVLGLLGSAFAFAGAQGFRMMGGGAAMSPGMVLYGFGPEGPTLREDVAKELKLTDAQKGKLGAFQQKQMEEMMAMFQSGERPSQEQMQGILKKRQEAEEKALKEILEEAQQKRLRELWLQRQGNGAISNEAIQKELGLSDDQKKKIKDLQAKQQAANAAIREKMMSGEIDRSEIMPLMEKNTKILNEEYGKLLTEEQAAKLKSMQGAPFKFENPGGG